LLAAGGRAGDELRLTAPARFAFGRRRGPISAVGLQFAGLHIVRQVRGQNLADDPFAQIAVLDGETASMRRKKIARHPIRAAEEHFGCRAFSKIQDAAVLQKAVHNAPDRDVLAQTADAGP